MITSKDPSSSTQPMQSEQELLNLFKSLPPEHRPLQHVAKQTENKQTYSLIAFPTNVAAAHGTIRLLRSNTHHVKRRIGTAPSDIDYYNNNLRVSFSHVYAPENKPPIQTTIDFTRKFFSPSLPTSYAIAPHYIAFAPKNHPPQCYQTEIFFRTQQMRDYFINEYQQRWIPSNTPIQAGKYTRRTTSAPPRVATIFTASPPQEKCSKCLTLVKKGTTCTCNNMTWVRLEHRRKPIRLHASS